jgi:hypothetical protein
VIWTTNTIRRTFSKTVTDNVATSVFRITTVNEAGNTDGGGYSVLVHALIGHSLSSGSSPCAAKSYTGEFCQVTTAFGVAATSAVSQIILTASAATIPATRDIGTVTMIALATSAYLTDIQFTVDITGSSVGFASVVVEVELIWLGYTTPPVMSQL